METCLQLPTVCSRPRQDQGMVSIRLPNWVTAKHWQKYATTAQKHPAKMDFSQRNILIFPLENSLSLSIWQRLMPITAVTLFPVRMQLDRLLQKNYMITVWASRRSRKWTWVSPMQMLPHISAATAREPKRSPLRHLNCRPSPWSCRPVSNCITWQREKQAVQVHPWRSAAVPNSIYRHRWHRLWMSKGNGLLPWREASSKTIPLTRSQPEARHRTLPWYLARAWPMRSM